MRREQMIRRVPYIIALAMLVGAVVMGVLRGAPAVVLWLAFAMLSGAALLFWETLKVVLDPTAPGDDTAEGDEEGVPAELEARKKAALRALRDIEFERAIQRLSEEDYKGLEKKYRAEARSAMAAIEVGVGPWLKKAEALLEQETRLDGSARKPAPASDKSAAKKPAGKKPAKKSADGDKAPVSEAATSEATATDDVAREAETEAETSAPETRACAKCETANDPDAVFCKKCGTKMEGAVDAN